MKIRMLLLTKEKYFVFSINFFRFQSVFLTKMRKIVTKYVVSYSNN